MFFAHNATIIYTAIVNGFHPTMYIFLYSSSIKTLFCISICSQMNCIDRLHQYSFAFRLCKIIFLPSQNCSRRTWFKYVYFSLSITVTATKSILLSWKFFVRERKQRTGMSQNYMKSQRERWKLLFSFFLPSAHYPSLTLRVFLSRTLKSQCDSKYISRSIIIICMERSAEPESALLSLKNQPGMIHFSSNSPHVKGRK